MSCWDELSGSDEPGISADELDSRTEVMEWKPLLLCFNIERHGRTVLGSAEGEVQGRSIDLT
jgi:hypothetical protein